MSALKRSAAWKFAFKVRHSDAVRAVVALPQSVKFFAFSHDHPIFNVAGRMGMGAMLSHLILILRFFETKGIDGAVRFTNTLYSDSHGADWLPLYFRVAGMKLPSDDAPTFSVMTGWDSRLMGVNPVITLSEAAEIFRRRVSFTDEITGPLTRFVEEVGMPAHTLGVHFRGTDKAHEAAVIDAEEMMDAVREAVDLHGFERIFLATDEPRFQQKMEQAFGRKVIVTYEHPGVLLQDGSPIHLSSASGHAKAVDALVQILLLSKCPYIIRTASYMSGWAKVINPAQKVMMLNKLYTKSHRFPDTEIAALMQASNRQFAV